MHGSRRLACCTLVAGLLLLPLIALAEGPAFLVKDINTVPRGSPAQLTSFGGKVFFTVSDVHAGPGLWRSDGTPGGTVRIKSGSLASLTPAGLALYFVAPEPSSNAYATELWKTDGTADGLVHLWTAEPGSWITQVTSVDGSLFFVAFNVIDYTHELWKTDGTAAGTGRLGQFSAPPPNFYPVGRTSTGVNGTLFFDADDGTAVQLWKSDGTPAGTKQLTRFPWPGEPLYIGPDQLTDVDGRLFFTRYEQGEQTLWTSDGTASGTAAISNIKGSANYHFTSVAGLTNVSGTLFFTAADDGTDVELWKSDGTEAGAGTRRVKDIRPGPESSSPSQLVGVDGTLLFAADDGTGVGIWRSDGTEAGTRLVRHVAISQTTPSVSVGPILYFAAEDASTGVELWRSDGTETGTVRVKDIVPGPGGSGPSDLTDVDGTLFFVADDGAGSELWQSDGTEAGTVRVTDLLHDTFGSNPVELTDVNGTLLFFANDGHTGTELWRSDGTAAGTRLVKEINPAGDALNNTNTLPQSERLKVGGTLFFTADDGVHGTELLRSDGTANGTVLVKDINPTDSSYPFGLTDVNGTVFFWADDGVHGFELWASDGTTSGTALVSDINSGPDPSAFEAPKCLVCVFPDATEVNGTLFFVAYDGTSEELWKSDGTSLGTMRVLASSQAPNPTQLTDVGGTLFFTAAEEDGTRRVWKSDGTAAGTVPVAVSDEAFRDFSLRNLNGTLVFIAFPADESGSAPVGLWRSDGTPSGTTRIADLGPNFAIVSGPAVLDGNLVFIGVGANRDIKQLWRSDGTAAGTVHVMDFAQGPLSLWSQLTNIDGALFFTIDGEIWRTDGTAAGTVPIQNFGTARFDTQFTLSGGHIFFTADDGVGDGTELWALPLSTQCSGDCNADGAVSIAELILAVDMALGSAPVGACRASDINGDGSVSIGEVISAVSRALNGCEGAPATRSEGR